MLWSDANFKQWGWLYFLAQSNDNKDTCSQIQFSTAEGVLYEELEKGVPEKVVRVGEALQKQAEHVADGSHCRLRQRLVPQR